MQSYLILMNERLPDFTAFNFITYYSYQIMAALLSPSPNSHHSHYKGEIHNYKVIIFFLFILFNALAWTHTTLQTMFLPVCKFNIWTVSLFMGN